jgi:hypothetical protein
VLIGWLAILVFTFYACTRMVAAGDTWVAMACGRHFVNHGVDTVEPFSANSHKAGPTVEEVKTWPGWAQWITDKVGLETVRKWHPTGWVNQNWLTHVIFYKLTTTLGSDTQPYYDALVWWKFGIYILAALALYGTTRLYGVNLPLAAIFISFAMVNGRSFFDIRPAGFSNLLVAVYVLILALASYRNVLYVWLLVPLVIFWSNVHGGYIYAFIVLVPFVGWHALMNLPRRWTIAGYGSLLWLVLCALANRFTHHEHLKAVGLGQDPFFYLTVLAVAGSMALSYHRRVRDDALVAYHIVVSCVLPLLLLSRFFPALPVGRLGIEERADLEEFIAISRLSYLGILAFALALGAVVLTAKEKVVRVMPWRGVLHTLAAGAVAFVAMVFFNPFHLTNLTHTFVISISKNAEQWRNVHEWHRAFNWTNPVGTGVPFLVLYVFGWLLLIAWVGILIYTSRVLERPAKKRTKPALDIEWPKMDVGLLIVAAMTIYMAIRSRRFIPIAGFAACPVLALLIQEIVSRLLLVTGFRRQGKADAAALGRMVPQALVLGVAVVLVVLGLSYLLLQRWLFIPIPGYPGFTEPRGALVLPLLLLGPLAGLAAVVAYASFQGTGASGGTTRDYGVHVGMAVRTAAVLLSVTVLVFSLWFGAKFKRVYLDPWPLDPVFKSVFMRMTASYSKPFEACEFIRQNRLSGNMYNYWTEGGFVAWGQDPDPNSGRTPLQLFMDGRAQAAYAVATFDLYMGILSGGPVPYQAARAGRPLKDNDYLEIGEWISTELRKYKIWTVLMPASEFEKSFTRGLDYSNDWRIVYTDDKQKLFVDVKSPQGFALYQGIRNGQTRYPYDYVANLARGHNLLLYYPDPAEKRQGLECLIQALNEYPSPASIKDMLFIGLHFPDLRPRIDEVCRQYAQDFEANKAQYARRDGYSFRLHVARWALARMEQVARGTDEQAARTYKERIVQYEAEIDQLGLQRKW